MPMSIFILIEQGPDIRLFHYSGLNARLMESSQTLWGVNNNFNYQYLPQDVASTEISDFITGLPIHLKLARRLAEKACNARLTRDGVHLWINFLSTIKAQRNDFRNSVLEWILSKPGVTQFCLLLERFLFQITPPPPLIREFLAKQKIDLVILSNAVTPAAIEILWGARKNGVQSMVIQNSWKDAFTQSHFSIAPNIVICPATSSLARLKINNVNMNINFEVIETLHTLQLARHNLLMNRISFCTYYGLNPERPIICYSAAATDAVRDEPELVLQMLQPIMEMPLTKRPQILIRINPMEKDITKWDSVRTISDVTLQIPEWDYIESCKWSFPRQEDQSLWASTILHSRFNISIPSTVTKDFLFFNKPVINVCFDAVPPAQHSESIMRYWEAPFYEEYRCNANVIPAFNLENLHALIFSLISDCSDNTPLPNEETLDFALDKIVSLAISKNRQLGGQNN